jgi:hypothetical protein
MSLSTPTSPEFLFDERLRLIGPAGKRPGI